MNNITIEKGVGLIFTRRLISSAINLFDKSKQTSEDFFEQRAEERWDAKYRQVGNLNLTDIYSVRLSNFVISGSSVSADNDDITALLDMSLTKARKWCPMAFGIGRVFLVPYVIGERIYLDIIPQSKEISLDVMGDDIHGFVAISDMRTVGKQKYARLTHYRFDPAAKTFAIENKAVAWNNGAEVPLSYVKEWETVSPEIILTGIEKPLFAVVDCPRDNRDSDRTQGAPITYGCEWLEEQILETIRDYQVEYRHKVSILGVDQNAIDPTNVGGLPREYIKTQRGGRLGESSDLFSVYSPEIRSQAYRDRLLELFSLHEKAVGTSRGILTPAESMSATATEVKRAMKDTRDMVNAMRRNIATAFNALAYAFEVWLDIIGKRVTKEYAITWDWNDEMTTDPVEELSMMLQLHGIDVVSDVEMRRIKYPNETPEEAQATIDAIKASKPDPFGEAFPIETFPEEGGGGE